MEERNIKYALKIVTEQKVKKAMLSLKTKKSARMNGISQEQMILVTDVLAILLMNL